MKKLLEFIVCSLVDNPKEVKVSLAEDEQESILSFRVAPDDMGKVIGKGGKIIKSIRTIIHARSIKEGKRVRVILEEEP
ncbi:MAG: KH domain-containing protein [Patescibacteria group bacterium]